MNLLQFRVQNFRSVEDSGWIGCDDVTTLVGVNEAGKSNLLLALWKLNPAYGGEINLLADMPRRIYSTARHHPDDYTFIEADLELNEEVSEEIIGKCLMQNGETLQVRVSKTFDGSASITFLNAEAPSSVTSTRLQTVIHETRSTVENTPASTPEFEKAQERALSALEQVEKAFPNSEAPITVDQLTTLRGHMRNAQKWLKASPYATPINRLDVELWRLYMYFRAQQYIDGVKDLVLEGIPKFVYYSNYGNLDAEIYLPQAIDNMNRTGLTGIAEAKARTLKVLFKYVGLNPQEILEMGQESGGVAGSDAALRAASDKKAERQALLHSAQSKLAREFRDWWKQGEYSFDFRADGNFFKIFVADRQRPEPIELENRSSGLQWFLSFYLVFIVESGDAHREAILLLDEAGHSLHPLAQRDLAKFFANLSETNQVIHTTQSPFLVDTNHVDRVKVVYVDDGGFTVASDDLRASEGRDNQQRSVYAVHAALGLSISDMLLQGCLPVIVEGPADQAYLNAIKNWLISQKAIAPSKEILFVPSGGVRGVKSLAGLLGGKEDELPAVVLDCDKPGQEAKDQLLKGLYKGAAKRVLTVDAYTKVPDPEIEDLIPFSLLEPLLTRMLMGADELFSDAYDPSKPVVGQIEAFAEANGVALESGWKVPLARQVKKRMLSRNPPTVEPTVKAEWKKLFQAILKTG